MEPASAFSVYEEAHRSSVEALREIRKKRKERQEVDNQKNVKQMEDTNQQMGQRKRGKSTKELNNINKKVRLTGKVNNIRSAHRKLKEKLRKERQRKKKNNFDKREAVQMTDTICTENIEGKSSEDDLNNINHTINLNSASNEINEEHNSNHNPIESSRQLFQWLLHPVNIETFFKQNWERTPMYVKRDAPNYYSHIVSTPSLDEVLRKNHILFTENIDITSYSNGVRKTHNPPGRALPSVVWNYYEQKCSVRMLNPQTFMPTIHALNATLQEFFGCFVGANLYLTPPNSQGFAPHYDDVEAFILQVEGEKRWRLYNPLHENEYLPRFSSKNFNQSEIGKPILDIVIKPGDLLYLPRGTIHQGMTVDDTHSLHVTLSVYQKNSWFDLLEKLLPQALERAAENDSRFREGLPMNYLTYVGSAYHPSQRKDAFKNNIKYLLTLLREYIDVDKAADLMAINHIHDFLPPFLFKNERKCTVAEGGEIMTHNGLVENRLEITLETRIRLLRSHCIRLIKDDTYKIFYSTENSKEYHEYELQYLEVDEEFVPGIKQIITSYPNFISVKELSIEDDDDKIQITKILWTKGLIITEDPPCSTN